MLIRPPSFGKLPTTYRTQIQRLRSASFLHYFLRTFNYHCLKVYNNSFACSEGLSDLKNNRLLIEIDLQRLKKQDFRLLKINKRKVPELAISSSPFAPISVVTAIRYWQEVQKDTDELLMNISPGLPQK